MDAWKIVKSLFYFMMNALNKTMVDVYISKKVSFATLLSIDLALGKEVDSEALNCLQVLN